MASQSYNYQTGQWEEYNPANVGVYTAPPVTTTPTPTASGTAPAQVEASPSGTYTPGSIGPGNTPPAPVSSVASITPTTPQATPPTPYLTNAQNIVSAAAQNSATPQASSSQQTAANYNAYFKSTSGEAPSTSPTAQIQATVAPAQSSDPIFSGLANSITPILQSMNQIIADVNNPTITGTSLQNEYNTLAQQNNLPQLQGELLNYQNIMNGTTDDIRQEILSAGGGATESQVLAMSSARNNVIMKQYNALSSQYTAASTNVQNMMQYASTDQQTALQKEQITSGIAQSMASIESNLYNMGITMQQNAATNYRAILTAGGPQALADSLGGNPTQEAYAEAALNLAPGTLSDPQAIASWQNDQYKLQQLNLSQYRAAVYGYNAGYGAPPTVNNYYGGSTPISSDPTSPSTPSGTNAPSIDPSTLKAPSWLNPTVPLSMSSSDMQQLLQSKNTKGSLDPGTNNVVVQGVGYYVQQPNGSYVLKSAIQTPDAQTSQYQQIQKQISNAQASPASYGPTVTRKWSLSATAAVKNYINLPIFQTLSGSSQYLAKMEAAEQNPGSVTDVDLIDSYINLSKGSGQVTEGQIAAIQGGSSVADQLGQLQNKVENGGVLSPNQRAAMLKLGNDVYSNYQKLYQPVYIDAIDSMQSQGIPPQFWTVMPDLNQLSQAGSAATNL